MTQERWLVIMTDCAALLVEEKNWAGPDSSIKAACTSFEAAQAAARLLSGRCALYLQLSRVFKKPSLLPPGYVPASLWLDGSFGDCDEVSRLPPERPCRLCGRTGPHRSGPGDRFHHVVLNVDGTWPE